MVKLVAMTKPVCLLRGGTSLEIIPLHVYILFVPIQVTTAITELVESSDKSIKEQVEHVDPSFIIFNSGIGPLEFLLATLPLTPHQIGIGQELL